MILECIFDHIIREYSFNKKAMIDNAQIFCQLCSLLSSNVCLVLIIIINNIK